MPRMNTIEGYDYASRFAESIKANTDIAEHLNAARDAITAVRVIIGNETRRGTTDRYCAEALGLTAKQLQDIRNGRVEISVRHLDAMAEALDTVPKMPAYGVTKGRGNHASLLDPLSDTRQKIEAERNRRRRYEQQLAVRHLFEEDGAR